MRALLVLPLLLCAAVHMGQVRAEVKAVKLCGREFLRAVVYTCGGSRWRRFLSETDTDGDGKTTSLCALKTVIRNVSLVQFTHSGIFCKCEFIQCSAG